MNKLFEKVKQTKSALVTWGWHTFGNTKNRLNAKQQDLAELMEQGYAQNLHSINKLKNEINTLLHHEEVFWW